VRRFWIDRPLGVKLAALVLAGGLALGAFAVITVDALRGTGETADELLASAEGTEDALLADMMHDAVRGDVLQALVSGGQGPLYEGAVADLAEHDETFRSILDEIVADDLDDDVEAAVTEVQAHLADAEVAILDALGVHPHG
jgi:methyl-accepting chemotaxis protein